MTLIEYEKNKIKHLTNIFMFVIAVSLVMLLIRYLLGYRKIIYVDLTFLIIVFILTLVNKFSKGSNKLLKATSTILTGGLLISLLLPHFEQKELIKTIVATISYILPVAIYLLLHYIYSKLYNKSFSETKYEE